MNWKLLASMALWGGLMYRYRQPRPVSLAEKVMVITGASSGIGEACAKAFGQAGARVVLVARRAEMLATLKAELERMEITAIAMPADITRPADIERLIESVMEAFGRIDVLVNNAGFLVVDPLEQISPEDISRSVEVNLYGTMLVTRKVLPVMQAQRSGHIINVSSVAGEVRAPGETIYSATKAGINAFSDALRLEAQPSGVSVSVVMPGWTVTPMIPNINRHEMRSIGMLDPLFPIDEAERVAEVIVEAARYKRREVILGGALFQTIITLRRMFPGVIDGLMSIYLRIVGTERFIRVLRNMQ